MTRGLSIPPFVVTAEGELHFEPWQPIRVFQGESRTELPIPLAQAQRIEREAAVFLAYSELRAIYPPGQAVILALQSIGEEVTATQEAALMGIPDTPP